MGSAHEPQVNQIEFLNEKIDHADQVVLSDPVFETVRKQDRLPALNTFDETRNADPPKPCQSLSQNQVSTQPRTQPMALQWLHSLRRHRPRTSGGLMPPPLRNTRWPFVGKTQSQGI